MENPGRTKLAQVQVKLKAEAEGDAKAKRMGKVVSWGSAAADVLLLIFARLPAASLARVSAVCTSWCGFAILFLLHTFSVSRTCEVFFEWFDFESIRGVSFW
jgi:hypothetical protein